MRSISGPGIPLQGDEATDCRHSRAQFDAYFREALKGRGLTSDERVIYAYLVSCTRQAKGAPVEATIATIAEDCETSYHRTWAALKRLSEQQLVRTKRRGLGLSNTYTLLPIDGVLELSDIVGKAQPESGVRPVRGKQSGQSGHLARAGTYSQERREKAKKSGYQPPSRASEIFTTSRGVTLSRLNR